MSDHSLRLLNRRSFTLIEILLTTVLFSMCSLAIYQVFSSGLKLWARAQHFAIEEDISIFFDKIAEDLRGSFYFTGIKFEGTSSRLTVPTFVFAQPDARSVHADGERYVQIGAVRYYLDSDDHAIHRAQANYGQALDGRFTDDKILVKPVNGFKVLYYMPGSKGVEPFARVSDVIPSSVYVEIKYTDGRSEYSAGRLIAIPVGL